MILKSLQFLPITKDICIIRQFETLEIEHFVIIWSKLVYRWVVNRTKSKCQNFDVRHNRSDKLDMACLKDQKPIPTSRDRAMMSSEPFILLVNKKRKESWGPKLS